MRSGNVGAMKCNASLNESTAELQRFIDAVRAVLRLKPIYLRNDTQRRDAACLEALRKGPTTVAELALYVFGDSTDRNRARVGAITSRLKAKGQARKVKNGTWASV